MSPKYNTVHTYIYIWRWWRVSVTMLLGLVELMTKLIFFHLFFFNPNFASPWIVEGKYALFVICLYWFNQVAVFSVYIDIVILYWFFKLEK